MAVFDGGVDCGWMGWGAVLGYVGCAHCHCLVQIHCLVQAGLLAVLSLAGVVARLGVDSGAGCGH